MSSRPTVHRMVMSEHVCPFELKAVDLLRRKGFVVEDRWLRSRAETEVFKVEHQVKTTPQILVAGERVAG